MNFQAHPTVMETPVTMEAAVLILEPHFSANVSAIGVEELATRLLMCANQTLAGTLLYV